MVRIDKELREVMSRSEWLKIPYDELLEHQPALIREKELALFRSEEPLSIPDTLTVENIIIDVEKSPLRLRIYRPKDKSNLPVLLYFHGGAFIFGTPEQYDSIFYRLSLDIDVVIVSVDYSLAPENPFPTAIHEGYTALNWINANHKTIGADNNKIMIGGSSAGGTIALSITHMARDRGENNIIFQYLLYPPTDDRLITNSMNEFAHAPMQTRRSAQLMWQHYLGDNTSRNTLNYAVPLKQRNFHGLPPACIIVCEIDPLKDEAIAYANLLKNCQVEVQLIEIKGAVHAFDFFPCALSTEFYYKQMLILKKAIENKA